MPYHGAAKAVPRELDAGDGLAALLPTAALVLHPGASSLGFRIARLRPSATALKRMVHTSGSLGQCGCLTSRTPPGAAVVHLVRHWNQEALAGCIGCEDTDIPTRATKSTQQLRLSSES